MWTIFKAFIEICYGIASVCFGFFGYRGMQDFSFPTRDQTTPSALEGEVLTTGLLGSPTLFSLILILIAWEVDLIFASFFFWYIQMQSDSVTCSKVM